MSDIEITFYIVDVFAEKAFTGNPACICLLPWDVVLSEKTMMNISAELGCTAAFLSRINKQDTFMTAQRFKLRWFTAKAEVKLCGHATLGTGAVLSKYYGNQSGGIAFITSGGELVVKSDGSKTAMELPVGISQPRDKTEYSTLIASMGNLPDVEDVQYCTSLDYLLIVLKQRWTREQFEQWKPDIGAVQKAGNNGKLKVAIITMKADHDAKFQDKNGVKYDFVSRVLGPWLGADEDPVTGSAHTILARYWSDNLSKTTLYARQCSPRGGDVNIQVNGDSVELKGTVTKVMQGIMTL